MTFQETFADVLAEQPDDWSFFVCHLTVDEPRRLTDARVALARANARPMRGPGTHDFEITVAHRWGHGAEPGIVSSALAILDGLGITGHLWSGGTYEMMRPAPPHRAGP